MTVAATCDLADSEQKPSTHQWSWIYLELWENNKSWSQLSYYKTATQRHPEKRRVSRQIPCRLHRNTVTIFIADIMWATTDARVMAAVKTSQSFKILQNTTQCFGVS